MAGEYLTDEELLATSKSSASRAKASNEYLTDEELLASGNDDNWDAAIAAQAEHAKRTRGIGETINDTVIETANSAAGMVGAIGDFIVPGNRVSEGIDGFIKEGEKHQSDVVRADKEKFQIALKKSETIGDDLSAVADYIMSSPLQATAQAIGSFGPTGLGMKAAKVGTGLLGGSEKAATIASRTTGIGMGVAGGGGDAAGDAYKLVQGTPDEVLMKHPVVIDLVAKGVPFDQIKDDIATRAARKASILPGIAGGVAGYFGAEKLLAGGAIKDGYKHIVGTGLVDGGTEALEEGIAKYTGQSAAQQYNPAINPWKNVTASAAMGGVLGLGTGASIAAITPTIPDAKNVDELISATKSSIDVELDNQTNQDLLDEISASNNATSSNAPVDQSYVPQPDTEPRPTINIAPDVAQTPVIEQSQPIDLNVNPVQASQEPQPTEGVTNGTTSQYADPMLDSGSTASTSANPAGSNGNGVLRYDATTGTGGLGLPGTVVETDGASRVSANGSNKPSDIGLGGKTQSLARDSSWVIRNKETGEVIMETFDKAKVDALNTAKYEAVPILQYMQGLNTPVDRVQPTVNSDFTPTPSSTLPSKPTTTPASPPTPLPLPTSAPKEDVQTSQPVDDTLKTFRTEILKYKGEGKTVTGIKTIYDATDRLKAIAEDTGETSIKAQQVWFNSKRKTLEKNGDIEAAALFERIVAQLKERINTAQEPAPVKIDEQVATVASDVTDANDVPVEIAGDYEDAILARTPTIKERLGGVTRQRGFNSITPREGYSIAYKPYGNDGNKANAGYYYIKNADTKQTAVTVAPKDAKQNPLELHYTVEFDAAKLGLNPQDYKSQNELSIAIAETEQNLTAQGKEALEALLLEDQFDEIFGDKLTEKEIESWLSLLDNNEENDNSATQGTTESGVTESTQSGEQNRDAEAKGGEDLKPAKTKPQPESKPADEVNGKLQFANDALTQYGASLNQDGFITKNGKILSVRAVIKKDRLRFESKDGNLLFTGGLNEGAVSSFVEDFWKWDKSKPAEESQTDSVIKDYLTTAADDKPADPISQMAASVESLAKPVQTLVENQGKPDSEIEIRTTSIDTLNSWKNYPGVIKSVKGWSLFKDPVYEKFVLMRKVKEANRAGGGYVSAEHVGYFDTENQASEWAALNSGQNKTNDVSKKAENIDTSKERVKGIDISADGVRDESPKLRKSSSTINIDGVERSRLNSNGKPIANSDEAIRNFYEWFGDSAVVDEHGRPLVVYHGTATVFNSFKTQDGSYFATDPRYAEEVGNRRAAKYTNDAPLTATDPRYTDVDYKRPAAYNSELSIIPAYLSISNPMIISGDRAGRHDVKEARKKGYDSIVGNGLYVAFEPAQIKSAIGNTGDFSKSNNNILQSKSPDTSENNHTVESATQAMLEAHTGKIKSVLQAMLDNGKAKVVTAEQAAGIVGEDALYMTAWHGSPHDHDGFSMDKVGTGEGAQAYGHGLYFAGRKEVAEYYRDTLSGKTSTRSDNDYPPISNRDWARDIALDLPDYGKRNMVDRINLGKYDEAFASNTEKQATIAWINGDDKTGRLYQVELAPSEDEYLLFDSPLSDLTGSAKSAIFEGSPNSISGDSKFFSDLVKSKPFISQGFGGLDVPTQRSVLSRMFSASKDSKVFNSVIELIPVDVMNVFVNEKLSPNVLLHDKAMLHDLFTAASDNRITTWSNTATALVNAYASATAKQIGGFGGVRSAPKLNTANSARTFNHIPIVNELGQNATGKEFYSALSKELGSDKAASEYLHSLGIRGIKYHAGRGQLWLIRSPDENTTGKWRVAQFGGKNASTFDSENEAREFMEKQNSHEFNYVIFNDQDVKITAKFAKEGQALAFYNPHDGITYFVADHIPEGYTAKEWEGLILHEISVHALSLGRDTKEFKSILNQIDLMRKAGNKSVVAAFKRVPKDTRPENVTEEALAYLLQEAPSLGISQRVIAWFRNAIRAIGKSFQTLQRINLHEWASKLSPEDLRFMAESALKNAEPSGVQNESDTPQFSKLSQTDTPAFKKWFGESKVVDEEGRPLVVYHGTDADIEAFSTTSKKRTNPLVGSSGIYLTSDSEYASRYAELRGKYKGGARGANVMPVYVRIENPVPNSMIGNYTHITKEQIVDYVSQGYDGIIAGNTNASEIIAFNPSQIKSAIGNNGDFSQLNNNILFSKNTNPITHPFQPENSGKPLDSWIKIFTRNQIVTLYRDSLIGKKLEEYKELRELVTADTNKLFEKADNFLLELRQIPKGLRDAFASLAHDSTLNNVDPSNPKYVPSPDAIKLADYLANNPTNQTLAAKIKKRLNNMEAAHKKLHAEFNALPTKEQELFKELRSKYTEQMTMVFDEFKNRIGRMKSIDPAIKASSVKKLDEQLADLLGRVYFPLYRAGNYIVKSEKAGEPTTVDHVESNFAADRLEKKLKKLGYTVSRSTRIVSPQNNKSNKALNAVRDLLDKAALKGKIEGAALSQLMDDIDQTVIQSLPDQSYRKSFIHRKGTKGYSDDFIRAYADAMRRGSINIANLRHGDKITTVIEDMRKDVKDASKVPGSNVEALNQVVDRVEQIEVDIRNPTSKLVSVSGKIAFAQMLGSLSNFILNITQTPLLTMPHLGAEYGYGKANLQLAMAYAKQMRSLKKQGTLSELGKWLDMRHGLVGNELDLMQQLHDSGALDLTQSFDLIDAANNPSYQENELSMNFMKVIALPQHVSEIVNRQVTALATIRLEMARSGSPLKAYHAARKAIDQTHFDYSKENRAKLMTGNTQSILFRFKQYAQQAAFLFVHTAKLALDGSTKLDSDGNKLDGTRPSERTKARKQLAGVLGMQILVAGTLGLPVFAEAAVAASGVAGFKLAGSTGAYVGVAGAIILAAALAFGDDDGEEFDVEVKKWFIQHFGKDIGSSLADGIIPRGLASRLNASELVLRRPKEARNSTDFANQWMISLLGAFWGGTVYNAGVGLKDIVEGDTAKGATKLIPVKAIKDLVTSWKWANDGMNVTNKDGEIITPVSKADIFFKGIGINPTSVVNAREYDNAKFTLHNALLKKQQKALKELREETDKTKRFNAIIKYNKFAPLGYEIDSDKVRGVIAREIKYKGKPNVVTGNPVQEDYLNKNTRELSPAY